MTNQTMDKVEVRKSSEKRINSEYGSGADSIERRQEYENIDAAGIVREQHIVRDSAAGRVGLANKVSQLFWLLGGLLEAILGLRFLLKLMAANPNSPFAQFVYQFTDLFLWPFQALISSPSTSQGMVLEIPTLFAILVYGLATWAAVKLAVLAIVPSTSERVTVHRREEN